MTHNQKLLKDPPVTHKRIKRTLSEMKRGPIQRTISIVKSPPKKKTKEKHIKINAEGNNSEHNQVSEKVRHSMNALLVQREEQIQHQANEIAEMKEALATKKYVEETSVEMKEVDGEKEETMKEMKRKIESLNELIMEQNKTHEHRMSNLENEAIEIAKENKLLTQELGNQRQILEENKYLKEELNQHNQNKIKEGEKQNPPKQSEHIAVRVEVKEVHKVKEISEPKKVAAEHSLRIGKNRSTAPGPSKDTVLI